MTLRHRIMWYLGIKPPYDLDDITRAPEAAKMDMWRMNARYYAMANYRQARFTMWAAIVSIACVVANVILL